MIYRRSYVWILVLVLSSSLFYPVLRKSAVQAQTATPPANVRLLLKDLSPEERVGQLFLVTFTGTDVSPDSQIYDLITSHHIGGVVLSAANDNFSAAPDTVSETYRLTSSLQNVEWESSFVPLIDPSTGTQSRRDYIPLFIGISQGGGGYPYDQIISGLTPLPNQMAIGATWQPDLARQTGVVLGKELSSLGFNLFLGPSLDVLEVPNPTGKGDLGTRVFGGDPFWVGEMGRAYIEGIHSGSNGRMAVISKHFPGRGGSDRLPEEEIATVRKSLEQLKQIELAPFFAVTGNAPTTSATTDGLIVSHIRYQGFQGNIRATTRPVSFDAQALDQILNLSPFVTWRASGGLMVSDDLGSQAVREFYAPGGKNFSARLTTRDAFLAGNDLLYLGNIVSSDAPDSYTTVLRALEFFAQKYREDPAFAQRVDDSVARILGLKFRVYNYFSIGNTVPGEEGLASIGGSQQVMFDIARNSATLVDPEPQDLQIVLPSPPNLADRLIFLTDTRLVKQCSVCPEKPVMAVDEFQQAVLRSYGPGAGGQVTSSHLSSYSFLDLLNLMDNNDGQLLESDLGGADWIIISLLDSSENQPQVIRRFLSEWQDLLRNKRVILFAFTAPYYLDATDISKLEAYFGMYSITPASVEVAARLLYQELTPLGMPPVSVSGIGYDLISVTTPDPNQIITLYLDLPPAPTPTDSIGMTITPEPTAIPLFRVGDAISVRTGIIIDHNGYPVPDGTVVKFSLVLSGEGGGTLQQLESFTSQGVAHASFRLEKPGLIEISTSSDPATISEIIQLDVSSGEAVAVTVIVPVPTETLSLTEAISPTPAEESDFTITADGHPRFGGWLLVMIFLGGGTWLAYWVGSRLQSHRWGIRWALCALLGGLVTYNYLALGLPGGITWVKQTGVFGVISLTIVGELVGWGCAWLWAKRISDSK